MTLADMRTNLACAAADNLRQNYGRVIKVCQTAIPVVVKAAETSAAGQSIYSYGKTVRRQRRMEHLRGRCYAVAKEIKMPLPSAADLFRTRDERDNASRESVREIPLEKISDFPNRPFKVKMDESMAESVKQNIVHENLWQTT